MKKPFLIVGLLLLAAMGFVYYRSQTTATDATGATATDSNGDGSPDAVTPGTGGLYTGQIGSNVTVEDQTSAIATAAAEFFSTAGNGDFSYKAPGIVLETSKFSVGNYTILKPIVPPDNVNNHKGEDLVYAPQLGVKNVWQQVVNYFLVIDRKPAFDIHNPQTYIVQ